MTRSASAGQAVFAATLIGIGILGLVQGRLTAIWPLDTAHVPAQALLAYVCAAVTLVAGVGLFGGLLGRRSDVIAARVLLAAFLLWLLLIEAPAIKVSWWDCAATAMMIAAAWLLSGDRGQRVAQAVYGVALIPIGAAHFIYLQHTAAMVPRWLPWHLGWACFTGAALIAAGLAVAFGVYARLAAALAALEMGLFTLLVWVPILAVGSRSPGNWSEAVQSWALTAAAWVVADSYRRAPWLAVTQPTMGHQPTISGSPRRPESGV